MRPAGSWKPAPAPASTPNAWRAAGLIGSDKTASLTRRLMLDQTLLSRALDHLCRVCMGRLFERADGLIWCSGCEATGLDVDRLCFCGTRLGSRHAELRCVPNPHRSPDNPALLAVAHPGIVRRRAYRPDDDTPDRVPTARRSGH